MDANDRGVMPPIVGKANVTIDEKRGNVTTTAAAVGEVQEADCPLHPRRGGNAPKRSVVNQIWVRAKPNSVGGGGRRQHDSKLPRAARVELRVEGGSGRGRHAVDPRGRHGEGERVEDCQRAV